MPSGRKRYLIDGYNVAHAIRRGPLAPDELDAARTNLVRILRPLVDRKTAVTIVFDSRLGAPVGQKPRGMPGVVEVVYARDADAEIVEIVRRSPFPERCIVVSRDRAVTGRATQLGAEAMRIEDVLSLATARGTERGDEPPDPDEPAEKYGMDEDPPR
jgi:predicted RNA-binding protein with PIN domain